MTDNDNGKLIDRKELMLRMREAGINDSAISKVVGVSRERVGQVLGRAGRYDWDEDMVELAKKMVESGEGFSDIAKTVGKEYASTFKKLVSLYSRSEWNKFKRIRKKKHSDTMREMYKDRIRDRLLEFKSTLNGNGARPIDLIRYSRTLYATATMIKPIVEWFIELGIKNTSTWWKS